MTRRTKSTLSFHLTDEQQKALRKPAARQADHDGLEFSYRAWNAAFVSCEEPLA